MEANAIAALEFMPILTERRVSQLVWGIAQIRPTHVREIIRNSAVDMAYKIYILSPTERLPAHLQWVLHQPRRLLLW